MSPRSLRRTAVVLAAALGGVLGTAVYAQRRAVKSMPAVERLRRMTPDQRRRALAELPPARRQATEQWLANWEKMTPDERRQLTRRYENFQQLTPERQQELRGVYHDYQLLAPARQTAVSAEAARLRKLSKSERLKELHSDAFQGRYSTPERDILEKLARTD
ncbi:MAG: DUF3106 domain-containing protein [Bryobacteraceae bacterium]